MDSENLIKSMRSRIIEIELMIKNDMVGLARLENKFNKTLKTKYASEIMRISNRVTTHTKKIEKIRKIISITIDKESKNV